MSTPLHRILTAFVSFFILVVLLCSSSIETVNAMGALPVSSSTRNEISQDLIETTCFLDSDGDTFGTTTTILSGDGDCDDAGESYLDTDCDDTNPEVNPAATEVIGDGIDQDCDGNDGAICYFDGDGDTFGTSSTVLSYDDEDCDDPGESYVNTDCNDDDPSVYPGAEEVPSDGVDQDCNGSDAVLCHMDADGDTFGTSITILSADADCGDPGESLLPTDCDDTDPEVNPAATEVIGDGIDQDCDGNDGAICYFDGDGDTFGTSSTVLSYDDEDCEDPGESYVDTDCDDDDPSVYPGAEEVPADGVDQDCNGSDLFVCYLPLILR